MNGPGAVNGPGGRGQSAVAADRERVESSLSGSSHLRLDDPSQVGSARRSVMLLGRRLGMDEDRVGTAALVVTELGKNLLQHAGGGDLSLWWSPSTPGGPALEILAIDRGPGMVDIERCFTDGYSTAGTPGTGLGAVRRAACALDLYTRSGEGTVLWARLAPESPAPRRAAFEHGAVCVPMPGEEAPGDTWGLCEVGQGVAALVADGLGHGALAAEASRAALGHFAEHCTASVEDLLAGMADPLAHTRGAAVGAATWSPAGQVRFAGVGNIAAVIERPGGERRHLVSHHGTLGKSGGKSGPWAAAGGRGGPRVQAFEAEVGAADRVVLHSDGINTRWRLSDYPGLVRRHPGVIAGVLHRDFRRRRDDATVLVLGRGSAEGGGAA